jgi:antitoxin (DNA-binding transcriptional repressor) of toxin-antitoxin stability system
MSMITYNPIYAHHFDAETRHIIVTKDGEPFASIVTTNGPFSAAQTMISRLNGGKAAHAATVRTRKQEAQAQQREAGL